MQIDLTVRDPAGIETDVAIRVPAAVPLGEVLPLLLDAVDAPRDLMAESKEQHLLGSPGLTTGSTVVLVPRGSSPGAADATRRADDVGLAVHVVGGHDAGQVRPIDSHGVTVGRGAHCDLVLGEDEASREHAVFHADAHAATVRDLGSTNGTFVESERIPPHSPTPVDPDEFVRIGNTLLTVRATSGDGSARARQTPAAERAPVVIQLSDRPQPVRPGSVQWLAAVLPALAGAGLAWATHSVIFLLFALLSPVMIVATALGDRFHWRRDGHRTGESYRRRRAEEDVAVATALRAETVRRRALHPDPARIARGVLVSSPRERRSGEPDAVSVRLASADLPAHTCVREGGVERPAGVVRAVPVTCDLRTGLLGLSGAPGDVAALARWLVTQLAVQHSPAGLALVLLLGDATRSPAWSWARWLPHLGGRVATGAGEWPAMVDEIVGSASSVATTDRVDPPAFWTVAVVDAEPGTAAARLVDRLSDRLAAGVAAVLLDSGGGASHAGCRQVFDLGGATSANESVVADGVSRDWAEAAARALATRSGEKSTPVPVPRRCHLLDVLEIDTADPAIIVQRWSTGDGRAATGLGLGGQGPVEIDLVRDGPHLLVAGTTGSGKSELLRSLVLGLALSRPPDDIAFVLVDYKGGAAFADADALPHVVGSVTDLDTALTRRALRSLDAELRRRERLFRAASAADLDAYHRSGHGPPLARLVIVVDEFATLADELPEFLRGLISVAQRGRSLGVHLVLATQRPGSAVTPEIRANTSTRIALRTVESGESQDVIGVPDAARIPAGLPGRAVLSAGAQPVVFQTAGVDGVPRERVSGPEVVLLGPWRQRPDDVDGTASYRTIVDAIRSAARELHTTPVQPPWSAPLPEVLALDSLTTPAPGRVPFALLDLPDEQRQEVLTVDLPAPASWLVVGGPRSGRTSALLTVALSAAGQSSPAELQIHVLDGGGSLADALRRLPHVATCLGPGELSAAAGLLRRLADPGETCGRVLLLVDRVDDALAGTEDSASPSTAELLAALRRSGQATIVLAGSRDLLAARATAGFDHRLLLRLSDRADYPLAGIPLADVPSTSPPGRAIRTSDGAQLHIALAGGRCDPTAVAEHAARVAAHWAGTPAARGPRLRPLPSTVDVGSLPAEASLLRLGSAGEAAIPLSVDVFAGSRRRLVAGPARSGRTTVLTTLLTEALRVGHAVLVAAPLRSPLAERCRRRGLPVLDPASTSLPVMPDRRTLVLVDDCEDFSDSAVGDGLARWAQDDVHLLSFVVAGRSDALAAAFTGLAAEIRRARCGLLLRPGPLDGDLVDVRVPAARGAPPGRGVLVGEQAWLTGVPGLVDADPSTPMPVQVAIT